MRQREAGQAPADVLSILLELSRTVGRRGKFAGRGGAPAARPYLFSGELLRVHRAHVEARSREPGAKG